MSFSPSMRPCREGCASESPLHDLEALIRSRAPLIAVESNEEPEVVRLVRRIGQHLQLKAYRWTVSEGLQAFDPCDQPLQSVQRSNEVLAFIRTAAQTACLCC